MVTAANHYNASSSWWGFPILRLKGVNYMNISCFIDDKGFIWSIDEEGVSKYPEPFVIAHDYSKTGRSICVYKTQDNGDRELVNEFVLYRSIIELGIAVELGANKRDESSVSLDEAVTDALNNALSFKKSWMEGNASSPDQYPLSMNNDDSGLWEEFIYNHQEIE